MSSTINNPDFKTATSIYDFKVNDIKGNPVELSKYEGHVIIIVNVASECGFTDVNYAELNELYEKYGDSKGLRILAFPCNQFGDQEPGDSETISHFIASRNVKFDVFEKIDVNGKNSHPLWKYLKFAQLGNLQDYIRWNFTKFIINKNGKPVERHPPATNPSNIEENLNQYW